MANWFHRFLNPHCPDCALERQDNRICQSCETLKTEVARLTADNERLLNNIIEKNTISKTSGETPVMLKPPSSIPWNLKRQILEREDRERAKLMKEAPKASETRIEDLEQELGIAEQERESGKS
jgi:hypothetical protein